MNLLFAVAGGMRARRWLAAFLLSAVMLAFGAATLHCDVEAEEHCSSKSGHCLLCHGASGSVVVEKFHAPGAGPQLVSGVAVQPEGVLPASPARRFPPARAPPAV